MLCDDSATIRGVMSRMLATDTTIEVAARVSNGQAALDALASSRIDVIVLDIEMPVMDGMTALPLLLKADPGVRIIVASTLTTRGADVAMRALRLGASDYITKPSTEQIRDQSFLQELLAKVTGLGRLRQARAPGAAGAEPARTSADIKLRAASTETANLLAIGSSTGGPQALFRLVRDLGSDLRVPVVVTQHMPPAFTATLADHLSRIGTLRCAEAVDGALLKPGTLHVAPGNRHLLVDASRDGLKIRLSDDPPENYCRPSVDPMLRSIVKAMSGRVLVAMLTGMGRDGLAGTRAVIEAGGTAVAQDEATSVVWGMPGAIATAGLCHKVLPLPNLARGLRDLLGQRTR